MTIRYKARALRDIEAIHDHIARSDPAVAMRVVLRIERAIRRLDTFPFSARPGVVAGTRLLAVPGLPYGVIHRIRGDTVDIIAVLHTARRRRS
jgi:toxin ParE1/3/4